MANAKHQHTKPAPLPYWESSDAAGKTFVVSHSRKEGRRHDYYVSRPGSDNAAAPLMRYRTQMLERTVGAAVCPIIKRALVGTPNGHLLEALNPDDPKTWAHMMQRIELQPGLMTIEFAAEMGVETSKSLPLPSVARIRRCASFLKGQTIPLTTSYQQLGNGPRSLQTDQDWQDCY